MEQLFKELSTYYYESGVGGKSGEIVNLLGKIKNTSQNLEWFAVVRQVDYLLGLQEAQMGGLTKIKREVKELLNLCDKEIKKIKPE